MFDNIGVKIKVMAVFICVLDTLAAFVGGLVLIANEELIWGAVTIIGGVFISLVGVFCLYGFGQLVENSDIMVQQNDVIIELLNDEPEDDTPIVIV